MSYLRTALPRRPFPATAGPHQLPRRTLFTAPPPRPSILSTTLKLTTLFVIGTAGYVYVSDSRAGVHRWLVVPALHLLTRDDPEKAHRWGIEGLKWAGKWGLVRDMGDDGEELAVEVWGKKMSNPLGLAAGLDKNGEAIDGLFDIGFGYVEIGSITPMAQPGNPQPRMFRLPSTESMVNRYGFNSQGHYPVLLRLQSRLRSYVHHHALSFPSNVFAPLHAEPAAAVDPITALLSSDSGRGAQLTDGLGVPRSLRDGRILAINLGKNKTSDPDSVDDFVDGVKTLGPFADALVINVSSPNTPGLRNLQRRSILEELLRSVVAERDALSGSVRPPLLVKIAPDLSPDELRDVGDAAKACKVDGIIVSNTTIQRPAGSAAEPALNEVGGLSGPPLKPLSLKALSTLYATTNGEIPLIGCGGIRTGKDALEYAEAGASLVQVYTALGYQGVGLPRRIKDELKGELKGLGKSWKQVVGSKAIPLAQIEGLSRVEEKADLRAQGGNKELEFGEAVKGVRNELDDLMKRLGAWNDGLPSSSTPNPPPAGPIESRSHVPLIVADSPTAAVQTSSPASARQGPAVSETVKPTVGPAAGTTDTPTSGFSAVGEAVQGGKTQKKVQEIERRETEKARKEERGLLAEWRRKAEKEQGQARKV